MIEQLDAWNLESVMKAAEPAAEPEPLAPPACSIFENFEAEYTRACEREGKRADASGGADYAPQAAMRYCGDCETESRLEDGGHYVCTGCGDIGQPVVDDTPEWRYYGQDDSKGGDPSRCGISSNYLMPESSIGTVISTRYGESYRMRQARQYHSWNVMDYRGRNLYRIFDKLQTHSQKHGINYIIIEHAKQLYKTINAHQLFRGQNKEGLIADCVYRACKDKGVPRSIKEIAIIFGLEEHVMTKGNRCFTSVWNRIQSDESVHLPPQANHSLRLSSPSDYIERFCSPLRLPAQALRDCLCVAQVVEVNRLVPDNTAPSIAAAVVYYVITAHELPISKEDIAKASKKSEVTIGKCFKKLSLYDKQLRACMHAAE
jgi:transcription initiation factor TFIIB